MTVPGSYRHWLGRFVAVFCLIVGALSAVFIEFIGLGIALASVGLAIWLFLRPTSEIALGLSFAFAIVTIFGWSILTLALVLDHTWEFVPVGVLMIGLSGAVAVSTPLPSRESEESSSTTDTSGSRPT